MRHPESRQGAPPLPYPAPGAATTLSSAGVLVLKGDVRAQLRDAEADIDLAVVRVPLSRIEDVVRALRQAAAQLVALTRGGGQGVQDLDTEELIGAVAAAAVPVAVALGHATDDLVLNRVADVSFPTPTALGAWLRSVVEEKRDRARQVAEAEVVERAGGLMEQLGRLQKAVTRLCVAANEAIAWAIDQMTAAGGWEDADDDEYEGDL